MRSCQRKPSSGAGGRGAPNHGDTISCFEHERDRVTGLSPGAPSHAPPRLALCPEPLSHTLNVVMQDHLGLWASASEHHSRAPPIPNLTTRSGKIPLDEME